MGLKSGFKSVISYELLKTYVIEQKTTKNIYNKYLVTYIYLSIYINLSIYSYIYLDGFILISTAFLFLF
jgi:hypothetical protein